MKVHEPFHEIYMKQIGGKYCSFICPKCGKDAGLYKMTGAHGWCEACKADFYNFGAEIRLPIRPGMEHPDMIGTLEHW